MKKCKKLTAIGAALAVMAASATACATQTYQTPVESTGQSTVGETGSYRKAFEQGDITGLQMVSGSGELSGAEGKTEFLTAGGRRYGCD